MSARVPADRSSMCPLHRGGLTPVAGAVRCLCAVARSRYRHPRRHGRPARRGDRGRLVRRGRRPTARGAAAARRRPGPRRRRYDAPFRHRDRRRHRTRPVHRAAGRADDRRHLRAGPRAARARTVHPRRTRVRLRSRRPLRRRDGRPAQGGLLGAVRRPPDPAHRAVRRPPADIADELAGLPVVGAGPRLYPDAFPDGRGPEHADAGALASLAAERLRSGAELAPPAAVSAQAGRAGPQELQGGHPQ